MKKHLLVWFSFLFFATLPCGWAKHWEAPFSFVGGVRIDYLLPDIWWQDLLAIGLVFCEAKVVWQRTKKLLFPLFLLLPTVAFAKIPILAAVYFLRFWLAWAAAVVIGENAKKKEISAAISKGVALALIWTTTLGIFQLIKKGTVFGWWFLGEPVFNVATSGVKKITIGKTRLPAAMATFPHANIFGTTAVLLLPLVFNHFRAWQLKVLTTLAILSLASSFSKTALLTLFLFVVLHRQPELFWTIVPKNYTFLSLGIWRRWLLAQVALGVVAKAPLFGVGWGCFTAVLPYFWQKNNFPPAFRFLQPVHHLPLLILSEVGIVGVLALGLWFKDSTHPTPPLLLLLPAALFDHWLWTTTQGVYLLQLYLSSGLF